MVKLLLAAMFADLTTQAVRSGEPVLALWLLGVALLAAFRCVHEIRVMIALSRRRITLGPGGIRAQGWTGPVDVSATELCGLRLRRPLLDGVRRRTGQGDLEIVSFSSRHLLDLRGFDQDAVRAAIAVLDHGDGPPVPGTGDAAASDGPAVTPPRREPGASLPRSADTTFRPGRTEAVYRFFLAGLIASVATGMFSYVAADVLPAVLGQQGPAPMGTGAAVLLTAIGLATLCAVCLMVAPALRIRLRSRVDIGLEGIELLLASQPHRPVLLRWEWIEDVILLSGATPPRNPARRPLYADHLHLWLTERPHDVAVLERTESAPGVVVYPLYGFPHDEMGAAVARRRPQPG
ncbi:ABC transporter permease [Pseudonocardia sp. HH130630-07]|uniref:ABC transporter permease n=1 Tax=Pseudonocardia sp. HH130630-07 TaxID=1690815 RepID=UPI0008153703|nr:ABC transporter permease [Pseudonocardia sp. HH130630-07]ANY05405.1 hypothetical protein AFB00_02735 [Pseudonocardia sp. HH130630-07]